MNEENATPQPPPETPVPKPAAEVPSSPPFAWQPFTFRGVAAFAEVKWNRLLLVQVVVAAIFSAAVVRVLSHNYAPVVVQAIQQLPEDAIYRGGEIQNVPDQILAQSKFFSIAIETQDEGPLDQSADLQIEFRHTLFRVCSLFRSAVGCLEFEYPKDRWLDLSRSKVEPWWGAWQPILLTGAAVVTIISLMLSWMLLALPYSFVALLIAWFSDRRLSWGGAWRLSGAALIPGGVLMVVAILLYGLRAIDPFGLIFFYAAHWITGWVYLIGAPFFAPRKTDDQLKSNPFV